MAYRGRRFFAKWNKTHSRVSKLEKLTVSLFAVSNFFYALKTVVFYRYLTPLSY
ncbi:FIG01046856: hypothetical protein [Citrobacter freundii]|uniref:Uncharacterized protein n=1 Tax=Citrobacter freundii TaxID=546 RepID=A0A7G2J047_CITFR|nr:FIG01046856: hypothetical protein [Citrobacter freundii]